MSAINVLRVGVLSNPAPFLSPIAFEIEYECLNQLADDLEWKMVYVGSAESEKYDQVLDSVLVGPVYAGSYRFVLEANPPDPAKLPEDDVLGVTVVLLTCSYRGKEFIRIGYYVTVEYLEEELRENPPDQPIFDKLHRSILADHPRVTRFPVDFDGNNMEQSAAGAAVPQGGADYPGATGAAQSSDMHMDTDIPDVHEAQANMQQQQQQALQMAEMQQQQQQQASMFQQLSAAPAVGMT